MSRSMGSSVGIATGYGLEDRDSIPGRDKISLFATESRTTLRDPPSLLSNGYRERFSRR
jgi:hypothetical protein